ncbi:MAG: HD domain-containing phosphohydrolase, partial [Pseudomonadota bacterium]
SVRIGVLALRGKEKAREEWAPMAASVNARSESLEVSIVPLDFDEIRVAVRRRSVDFVLANSAFYVELEMRYGVSPVVTRQRRVTDAEGVERGVSQFGGVFFTRADNDDIDELSDIRGKRIAAVDASSLGGWLMAVPQLREIGIDPAGYRPPIEFAGTHDAVVEAVLEGQAEVGIVRTGVLEALNREGRIDISAFHVLASRHVAGFPYRLSTALYPEWPLARVPGVPEDLAVELAVLLMQEREEGTTRWTLPLNYQPVHDLLRELKVGPYEYLRDVSWRELLIRYWQWALTGVLLFALAWVMLAYVLRINRRLRSGQRELSELNESLETRVAERTGRIGTLLERETHLRAIVETVADVNQIIITSEHVEQMLKAACDRLIGHADYRFAWIAMREPDGRIVDKARSYGSPARIRSLVDLSDESAAVRAMSGQGELIRADVSGDDQVRAVVALPLAADAYAEPFGALCVFTARTEGFEDEEIAMLEQLAGDLGFAVHSFESDEAAERLQQERIENYEATILSMVDLIEKRDTYTAGHSRRVADYCARIAREVGLDDRRVETLYQSAILHDIGKIVIPDAVLLKPARLTDLEFELIQSHVMAGYETLSRIAMYRDLAEIMLYHHERQDGSGYPQGLSGDAIPLEGRIMAVADSFDAMTSDRIYKGRKSVAGALDELRDMAGKQYDAQVVVAATRALAGIEPPAAAEQLPSTPVEQKRFAYFFSDQLTGVHNAQYLKFLLRGHAPFARHAGVVLLHGFASFNLEAGWNEGDRVLRELATFLVERCPEAQVFRVGGDDFVVLAPAPCPLGSDDLKRESVLADTPLTVEVRRFALDAEGVERLERMAGILA